MLLALNEPCSCGGELFACEPAFAFSESDCAVGEVLLAEGDCAGETSMASEVPWGGMAE